MYIKITDLKKSFIARDNETKKGGTPKKDNCKICTEQGCTSRSPYSSFLLWWPFGQTRNEAPLRWPFHTVIKDCETSKLKSLLEIYKTKKLTSFVIPKTKFLYVWWHLERYFWKMTKVMTKFFVYGIKILSAILEKGLFKKMCMMM